MATAKKTPAPLPLSAYSLGGLIDSMFELRERKRALEEQVKTVEGNIALMEAELMGRMAKEGIDGSRGSKASCSITSSVSGNLVDWDAMTKFIKRTGHFQLFQRRISDPAYRELLETGKEVPGIEKFIRKRLNLRTL